MRISFSSHLEHVSYKIAIIRYFHSVRHPHFDTYPYEIFARSSKQVKVEEICSENPRLLWKY